MVILNSKKKSACKEYSLERASLLRGIYRALIQNGRTYAAFEPQRINPLIKILASHKTILDPMAGYGILITSCAKSQEKVSAYCIEYNPPAYLWQILINPCNAEKLLAFVKHITDLKQRWPSSKIRACMSNDWFPAESKILLMELWKLCKKASEKTNLKGSDKVEIPLAFILPFIGRISAWIQGNVVPHIKKGGICVYENWKNDFNDYISNLQYKITQNYNEARNIRHNCVLGNCLSIEPGNKKFSAMITSPPYPNSRDYYTMFGPENAFLSYLEEEKIVEGFALKERLIGSPRVSVIEGQTKKSPDDVKSPSARNFLKKITQYQGSKQAVYDNKVYYLPYYSKYFHELECAYKNISSLLNKKFEGYIVVVNNTHRKQIVPVSLSIIDIWRSMGFEAEIVEEYTRELSHVGGLNPNVKGLTARHMEYTIKVFST